MSIFGIIGLSFLIFVIIYSLLMLPWAFSDSDNEDIPTKYPMIVTIIIPILWVCSIFIGVGMVTEDEKVYVQKYLAQKQTIEMSLASEELTGLERVQLVTKATELNGEFAEKKARFNLWHFVVYDNTIYDGVELIDLNGDSVRNKGN